VIALREMDDADPALVHSPLVRFRLRLQIYQNQDVACSSSPPSAGKFITRDPARTSFPESSFARTLSKAGAENTSGVHCIGTTT